MTLQCIQDTRGGLSMLVVETNGFASPQNGYIEPQQGDLAGSWEFGRKVRACFYARPHSHVRSLPAKHA